MRTVVLRGTGQEDRGQWSIMEASGKVLFIFSQNDWWMPTLLFLCGDSHSSHQRSQQKILHFPLQRRVKCSQIPSHSSTQIPVSPNSPLVHFQEVKYTDPGCPAALYGKSLETPQSITVKPKTELTSEKNHHGTSLKNQIPEKCWHKMENRSERYSDENWRGTSKKKPANVNF